MGMFTKKSKKKVLLIEDDIALHGMYRARLEHSGYKVLNAMDGEEGLEVALAEQPNCILLDLMLPRRGGLGVLRVLKSQPETKDIPVIILTQYGNEAYKQDAAGKAQYFLLKSEVRPRDVVEKVQELIGE